MSTLALIPRRARHQASKKRCRVQISAGDVFLIQDETERRITDNGVELQIGGDVIVTIDEQSVRTMDDLIVCLVAETRPGLKGTLTVLRDAEERGVEVTLGTRPREP